MRYHKTTTTTTQRKPHSLSRTQTGFSLLELLISMAITVIAVIAAVGLMTKFARTVGAFTEVSTMEEARGTSETLLRADLDGAGHNLTRPSPPLAGTIFATLTSFDFYTWSNGTITKTGATGWDNPKAWMKGGNVQLSRAFADFAKKDPARASEIILKFSPDIGARAAGYALALAQQGYPLGLVKQNVRIP